MKPWPMRRLPGISRQKLATRSVSRNENGRRVMTPAVTITAGSITQCSYTTILASSFGIIRSILLGEIT